MPRPSRIRRIAKWSGVVVCVVLVVAWVVSPRHNLWYQFVRSDGSVYWVSATQGCIRFGRDFDPPMRSAGTWESGFYMSRLEVRLVRWLPQSSSAPGNYVIWFPLWIPFLLGALPTAYLFYRDRRYPPGHCQHCGYDLQGNVSGVCPECGAAA